MNDIEKAKNDLQPRESSASTRLSRRDLLGWAGQGAVGLAALALLHGSPAFADRRTRLERLLPGAKEIGSQGAGRPGPRAIGSGAAATAPRLSLPMWGDGLNFDQPQYYETIITGDIDGDRQDELLIRGPAGILANRFDPATGQWMALTTQGPPWSDALGWANPASYTTIQCADVDGDGIKEIMGRGPTGIVGYKYDPATKTFNKLPDGPAWSDFNSILQPTFWPKEAYYSTIQFGDVDGDGAEELIGRDPNGIQTWKYYPATQTWGQIGEFNGERPAWADIPSGGTSVTAWNLPQYYETIQLADIDGDGKEELLGRSKIGLEFWKMIDNGGGKLVWSQMLIAIDNFTDVDGWTQPRYYSTIQCADIDGDGVKEIMGRDGNGIMGYKFVKSSNSFVRLPDGPGFSDASGVWNQEQYYSTLHYGDIDGDGRDELIGRDVSGIQTWVYDPINGGWYNISGANTRSPQWTDDGTDYYYNPVPDSNDTKWDEVQYYSTIQFARVYGDNSAGRFANPNNPGTGAKKVAALLGRDRHSLQTWRYIPAFFPTQGQFVRASAPFPDFTSANADPIQAAAYKALDTFLRPGDVGGNIRDSYNNLVAPFTNWMGKLYDNPISINPPGGYPTCLEPAPSPPSTITDQSAWELAWQQVTWQVYWEMAYVVSVNYWYSTKTADLITGMTIGKFLSISDVGSKLNIPPGSSTSVALNITSLIFGGAAALLGFPGLSAETANIPGQFASVVGVLGSAFSAAATYGPTEFGSWQGAYADLETKLENSFTESVDANSRNNLTITGGGTGLPSYQIGDYGLMAAIGQQIHEADAHSPWTWPVNTTDLEQQAAHTYGIQVWQAIIPASDWYVAYNSTYGPPSDAPQKYLYDNGDDLGPYWLDKGVFSHDFPSTQNDLFDPQANPGDVWPLGVPLSDVFNGNNGWPKLTRQNDAYPASVAPKPAQRPANGTDIHVSVTLSRNATNGVIELSLTGQNKGLTGATNLNIVSATLGGTSALSLLPRRRTRVATGKSQTATICFPASAGAAGNTVVLRIQGKYKGGTFGGSFRVKLP